jgi:hypothetical protein
VHLLMKSSSPENGEEFFWKFFFNILTNKGECAIIITKDSERNFTLFYGRRKPGYKACKKNVWYQYTKAMTKLSRSLWLKPSRFREIAKTVYLVGDDKWF